MDRSVVLITELDQVGHVGLSAVDPVLNVVGRRELGMRAAGEPASLVPSPDLDSLRIRR